MAKRWTPNNTDLHQIDIDNIEKILEPWALAVLLEIEPYTFHTDDLFDKLLSNFENKEMYDYCIVIRDEINKRK
jgi:hypothetical protein